MIASMVPNKDAAAVTKYYLVSLPKAIGSGAVILAAGAIMLAIDWRIGVIMLCLNMLQKKGSRTIRSVPAGPDCPSSHIGQTHQE